MQRWCHLCCCWDKYPVNSNPNTIQRANTIHCDSEMMLLPNLSKSQYHTFWFRDGAVTKSAKEHLPYIVMQRWCYPRCQTANFNTIHCVAEMMLLPNLSKSKYHPLWFRDNPGRTNTTDCDAEMMLLPKSAKEQIPSIVMQLEIMLLPNLPKSQYHTLWCRDNPFTQSVKGRIHPLWCKRWCYPCCQRVNFNIIHCDEEISVKEPIPSFVMQRWLPKSQYHPLDCRD